MDKLREAMKRYMQQLARNAQRGNQQMGQMPPNARMMSQKDLQDLLKAIEDLARTGNRDQARQMLAALMQMLENMRMVAGNQRGGQQGQQGSKASSSRARPTERDERRPAGPGRSHGRPAPAARPHLPRPTRPAGPARQGQQGQQGQGQMGAGPAGSTGWPTRTGRGNMAAASANSRSASSVSPGKAFWAAIRPPGSTQPRPTAGPAGARCRSERAGAGSAGPARQTGQDHPGT